MPSTKEIILTAIALNLFLLFFSGMILDGGRCATIVVLNIVGYGCGVLIIKVRRNHCLVKSDYVYLKYGTLINIFTFSSICFISTIFNHHPLF
jgi:hypothetical protein